MKVAENILAIRKEKSLNQSIIADALDVDIAVVSNIEKGKRELKVSELEKIAKALEVDVLYLITYPDIYIKKDSIDKEPVEAILQIKLSADKKEKVLNMLFGENDIELFK